MGPGERVTAGGLPGHRGLPLNGRTIYIQGGTIRLMEGWHFTDTVEQEERWTVAGLHEALAPFR